MPFEPFSVVMLLRWAAIFQFVGRGWQHIFWETPYRAILWDQKLMEPVLGLFGIEWDQFATSLQVDQFIQGTIQGMGVLFWISAFALLVGWSLRPIRNTGLIVGGVLMFFLWIAKVKAGYPSLIVAMELAIQVTLPFLVLGVVQNGLKSNWLLLGKVAVAATFIGHGLFAAGILPVPGHFVNMTMSILGIGEAGARQFLWIMGLLDFGVAFLLFSGSRFGKYGALYAALWGFATATARVVAPIGDMPFLYLMHQWGPETLFRLPHGMVPLALAFWMGLQFIPPRPLPVESK